MLKSADHIEHGFNGSDRDQVEPTIQKTSCGLYQNGGLDVGHGRSFCRAKKAVFFLEFLFAEIILGRK